MQQKVMADNMDLFRNDRLWAMMGVAVLAILMRVVALFHMPPDQKPWADGAQYVNLGVSLAEHKGYCLNEGNFWPGKPTIIRAPGWPLILAIPYSFSRETQRWGVARGLTAAFDVANALLVIVLACGLRVPFYAALTAGGLYAINLVTISYCPLVGVEVPGITVVLTFLIVCVYGRCRNAGWCILTGLVAGVALLVRINYLLIPVLWGMGVLWVGRNQLLLSLRKIMIVATVVLLIMAPWALRNAVVFGGFPILGAGGGETFYGGNNSLAADPASVYWGYIVQPGSIPGAASLASLAATMNEHEVDRYWMRQGYQWLWTNPEKLPLLIAGKLRRAFVPIPYARSAGAVAVGIFRGLVMIAAITGILVAIWRGRSICFDASIAVSAVVLTHVLTVVIFCGVMRYVVAMETLLMIPAGYGLVWFWRKIRSYSP